LNTTLYKLLKRNNSIRKSGSNCCFGVSLYGSGTFIVSSHFLGQGSTCKQDEERLLSFPIVEFVDFPVQTKLEAIVFTSSVLFRVGRYSRAASRPLLECPRVLAKEFWSVVPHTSMLERIEPELQQSQQKHAVLRDHPGPRVGKSWTCKGKPLPTTLRLMCRKEQGEQNVSSNGAQYLKRSFKYHLQK